MYSESNAESNADRRFVCLTIAMFTAPESNSDSELMKCRDSDDEIEADLKAPECIISRDASADDLSWACSWCLTQNKGLDTNCTACDLPRHLPALPKSESKQKRTT